MDGVFGTDLRISWAKYRRGGNKKETSDAQEQKRITIGETNNARDPNRTFKDILLHQNSSEKKIKEKDEMENHGLKQVETFGEVKAFVDDSMIEKLRRSIVGESAIPLNMEEIAAKLFEDWHTLQEVKTLGSFKMILIFDTEEEMQEALQSAFLLNHFGEIRQWSPWETNRTRRAWVEIIGIPPHAWNVDNVERIAAVCGQILEIDEGATNSGNFDSVVVRVDTSTLNTICHNLTLDVEGDKFNIPIMETWREATKVTRKWEGKPTKVNPVVVNTVKASDQAHNLRCDDEDVDKEPLKDPLGGSLSTRCILEDRDSEEIIKETQHAIKMGNKVIGLNGIKENHNDEATSGPTCPPGFEVTIHNEIDPFIQEKGCSHFEQEIDLDHGHKRTTMKDKRKEKHIVETNKKRKSKKKREKLLQMIIQEDMEEPRHSQTEEDSIEDESEEVEEVVEESSFVGDDNNDDVDEAKKTMELCEEGGIIFNEEEDVVLATLMRKKNKNEKCHKKVQKYQEGMKLSTRLLMSGTN